MDVVTIFLVYLQFVEMLLYLLRIFFKFKTGERLNIQLQQWDIFNIFHFSTSNKLKLRWFIMAFCTAINSHAAIIHFAVFLQSVMVYFSVVSNLENKIT